MSDPLSATGKFRALRDVALASARELRERKDALAEKAREYRRVDSERASRVRKILVVDDDHNVLRSLARVFHAHDVRRASSAREVLALVGANVDFDALVVDYQMPGETGLELIEALRAFGISQPIVLISGVTGPDVEVLRGRAVEVGADAFIQKPFEVGALLATVLELTR